MESSVAEWLECLTPNQKVFSSIPHSITSVNLDFNCCLITYSVIKDQLLSYNVYMVWEVKDLLSR